MILFRFSINNQSLMQRAYLSETIRTSIAIAAASVITTIGIESVTAQPKIVPNTDNTKTVVIQQGNNFNISGGTSSSDGTNLFHSFQEFSLDANQVANFLSNPQIRNILSRINGGNPSIINGLIQVTGGNSNLFLMNPAGIIFGPNVQLNVPGDFFATTASGIKLDGGWFNAFGANDYINLIGTPSEFKFEGTQAGAIINAGDLTVEPGNNLSLIAGQVINTGTINAPGGKITISAVPGSSRVKISQEGQLLSLEVELPKDNNGNALPIQVLDLPGLLTGAPADLDTGLNTTATGEVELTNSGVTIPNLPSVNTVSGKIDVSSNTEGEVGGEIQVLGDRLGLVGAHLDASGTNGGGTVLIGGDYQGKGTVPNAEVTFIDSSSTINADALQNGNGGKVIVWADNTTRFYGKITARGGVGGGDGGLVETSGKIGLDVNGASVDASADRGRSGTWLLDPTNVEIISTGTGQLVNGIFDPPTTGTASRIAPNTISSAMDTGTSVEITTANGTGGNGDITLTDSIIQNGGGTASLTLTGRRFQRQETAQINLTSTGSLTFNLNQINPEANAPSSSIQNAIDAIGNVAGARTINLGAGIYENQGTAAEATLTIDKNLTLMGAGTTAANETSLDGIRINVGGVGNVVIDSLIIGNNDFSGNGGAIFNSGNLTVTNSIIQNNEALSGGGIFNEVTLNIDTNTIVTGNQPDNISGPGIVNIITSPTTPPVTPNPDPEPIPPPVTPNPDPEPIPVPVIPNLTEIIFPEQKIFAVLDKSPNTIQIRYIEQARRILQRIQQKATEKSALIYVNFLPPGVEFDQATFFARIEEVNTSEFEEFLNLPTNKSSLSVALPFSDEDRLELLLITADGKPKKISVAVTRKQVMEVAQQLYEEVANLGSGYLVPAAQMYQWLIAPIAQELEAEEINNLAFILPTGLRLLPLAAFYDQNNDRYLVQQYSVGLAPSVNLIDLSYRNLQDAPVLAAGASQFKPGENQPALPAVEIEVSQIANQIRGGKTILNEEFTLEKFKQARQANPFPIIHLATHADFQTENPEQIYLQFYDRKLELDRLRELRLYDPIVDLIVISACRSAYGDEEAELGFGGLAVQAGAKSALASLWYVGDTGTLALMSEFYRQLSQEPFKAEALRETQVALITGKVKKQGSQIVTSQDNISLPPETSKLKEDLSHPFYWAAFTLIGSPW